METRNWQGLPGKGQEELPVNPGDLSLPVHSGGRDAYKILPDGLSGDGTGKYWFSDSCLELPDASREKLPPWGPDTPLNTVIRDCNVVYEQHWDQQEGRRKTPPV